MNLQSKLLAVIFGFLILQLSCFYVYYHNVLLYNLSNYEQGIADQNFRRGLHALQNYLNNIQIQTQRWSDLHPIDAINPQSIQQQLINNNLNVFLILNNQQKIDYQLTYDEQTKQSFILPSSLITLLESKDLLKNVDHTGFISTQQGPFIISLHPVFDAQKQISHYVITGKRFTQDILNAINTSSDTALQLWPMATLQLPSSLTQIVKKIQTKNNIYITKNKNMLIHYQTLPTLQRKNPLIIGNFFSRRPLLMATQSLQAIYAIILMINMVCIILLLSIMNIYMIKPFKQIIKQLYELQNNIDIPERIQHNLNDEIGILCESMNQLIMHFYINKTSAIRHAYRAGTQNTHTEMLKNVLYSTERVIKKTDKIENSLHQLPLNVLEKVTAELVICQSGQPISLITELQAINTALHANIIDIRQALRELRGLVLHITSNIRTPDNLNNPKAYTIISYSPFHMTSYSKKQIQK